jgi:glycosyltransferase involved in cell wall biosynthesis
MVFSTHIVTLSERERDQALSFPFVSKKIRMIPLGIEAPIFMSKSSIDIFMKSILGEMPDKRIIVGTVAELHKNKGLTYAIEAIEKLKAHFPSILFFIIGEGEERASLTALIAEKKLEKHVILAGYIVNAVQYIKGFNIFLLPSLKEGLPYTLLEAGYANLPVVATTVGGIPEIVDDMNSGVLVQSKKSDEIFHALEFLIRHKNIQREYGKNLGEKVRTYFNIEKMRKATEELYTEKTAETKPQ